MVSRRNDYSVHARIRAGNGQDPDLGKGTRFKPGEPGNPAGKPKGRKDPHTMIQKMMSDPRFIDKLSAKIKNQAQLPDEDFQSTPMEAIITAAIVEAMNLAAHPTARHNARNWLRQGGWGTQVDVTSKGERISETPKIISVITPRPGDAAAEAEAS